jgi:NAD(P)-dependent dehydrogenase (short-subunit alcohol dehydrogenase family)
MAAAEKVALITGAGTGIGRAAALALARNGYSLVLSGRRPEPLAAVEKEAKAAGAPRVLVVRADVGDEAQVRAMFAKTKETFGRLDVLFNNAGIGAPAVPVEDLPFATWKAVLDTNMTGTFLCTQEAIKIMKSQTPRGGRIINNGSISAHTPRPNTLPYTATKHAMTGFTKSTALDGRKYDIACSQIDIGNAETPMAARMKDGVPQPNGQIMPEPLMDVSHVGSAIAYMASLPLDANVLTLTIKATKMPFEGRG